MRGQQLKALAGIIGELQPADAQFVRLYASLSGQLYDTSSLSDKALEQIDTMAARYLDQVR
jgi:hypothetical protein